MSKKKLASLDSLRGIAILLVIAAHFGGNHIGERASIFLGNAGVILFFFLSGFLMDMTLHADPRLASYVMRRSFRILPMYWCSLLLVVAVGARPTVMELASNATFTAPLLGQQRMLGVYWTLYIEVLFYCFAPLLHRGGDSIIRISVFAALAAFGLFVSFHHVGSGAPFYLIFCLCGMQIGACHRGAMGIKEFSLNLFAVAIASSQLLPVSVFLGIVPISCAAALFLCLRHDPRFPPLEFIGNVSYSWYLLHMIFGHNLALPIRVGATLVASVVTFAAIERPFKWIGKMAIIRMTRSRS